ncbi:MAG: CidA/LrgA family protein [Sphingomonadaceae bacterium]
MIQTIALLLLCQLAGEILHRILGLPLPGAVLGMALLFLWLLLRPRPRPTLTEISGWLLGHMTIMFLPSAVGIMEHGSLLPSQVLVIVAAMIISTLLTLAVSALVFQWVAARTAR